MVPVKKLRARKQVTNQGFFRIGAGGKHYMALPVETSDLVMEGPSQTNTSRELLDRTQARGLGFTEMQSYWTIPFHDSAVVNTNNQLVRLSKDRMPDCGSTFSGG